MRVQTAPESGASCCGWIDPVKLSAWKRVLQIETAMAELLSFLVQIFWGSLVLRGNDFLMEAIIGVWDLDID